MCSAGTIARGPRPVRERAARIDARARNGSPSDERRDESYCSSRAIGITLQLHAGLAETIDEGYDL
jgi:hypothetical protein